MKNRNKEVVHIGKITPMVLISPMFLAITSFVFTMNNSILFYLSLVTGTFMLVQLTKYIIKLTKFKIFVTDRSVLILSGAIKKNSIEYIVPHISGISYSQSVIGRMLGYGDISLVISGIEQPPIKKIDNPALFCEKVKSVLTDEDDNTVLFYNNLLAS